MRDDAAPRPGPGSKPPAHPQPAASGALPPQGADGAPWPVERAGWGGEALGALNALAVLLPLMLGWATIAFGAVGLAGMQLGLTAATIAVVPGTLAYLAISRVPMPAAAPSSSSALLLGSCIATLAQDEAVRGAAELGGVPTWALLLAASGAVVAAAGGLLVLLGALRAGALVRFVPQPVLAGFMNGVAVLMVIGQLPALWPARAGGDAAALAAAAAAVTAVSMAALQWRWPRWPAALLALAFGSAAALAMQAACGGPASAGCALAEIGTLQVGWPAPDVLAPLLDTRLRGLLEPHLPMLAGTAVLLALVGALESALNLAQIDERLRRRSDPNREFIALGVGNIASGLLGGLPLLYGRLRAVATLGTGPCTWRASLLACLFAAMALAVALPWVARVPLPVVAGMVCMLAWAMVDQWTRRLLVQWWRGERTAELAWSLATVALVGVVTALAGLVTGVAVGVVLSVLVFMRAMNRSLVRLRYTAAEIASRRIYPPKLEALLAPLRPRVAVIELEGVLFFGNIDRLEQEAEQVAARHLVLDLRRVSLLDASGAVRLTQLRERLAARGCTLALAGVTPGNRHGRTLRAQGMLAADAAGAAPRPSRWQLFADADHALEAAEMTMLRAEGADVELLSVPLSEHALLQRLSPQALAWLEARLPTRRLAAGERLFAQGDAGTSLFLLVEGSVSALDPASGQRFVTFSPGMCFGETAVLDGRGRTADARADQPSTVREMPVELLHELQRTQPEAAATIYRQLALHLSERLRGAVTAWQRAAG